MKKTFTYNFGTTTLVATNIYKVLSIRLYIVSEELKLRAMI